MVNVVAIQWDWDKKYLCLSLSLNTSSRSNVFTLTGAVIVVAVTNNQCWPSHPRHWTGALWPILWLALAKCDHYCLVSVMTVTPVTPCLNVSSTLPHSPHTMSKLQSTFKIELVQIFRKTRVKTIVLFEFDMKRDDFYEISTVSFEKERKNIVIIYQIN